MEAVTDPTRAMLREAWDALGGPAGMCELVEITGDPRGLLPSRLPALPAIVAAVSASTLAAALLESARRGKPPEAVRIDLDHVALAARSERYARAAGADQPDLFDPFSRFWRTSDGWLRLHTNYAWHRERALGVLGCRAQPQDIEQAILAWPGEALEDALAAAGAVGFAVRTEPDWSRHPQGRAVAELALLDTLPASGAGPQLEAGRVAGGVRVLDLTRVIAGPVAARTLAAWGADVLRLDSPHLPEIPALALDTLPGKRSALLDFADPAGRARLELLLGQADVVVDGYRPGALAEFGLSTDSLTERHPHLTVVKLSAWGAAGPWAQRRGFDSLVQCSTGIAVAEGDGERPGVLPAQILDHATGYLAAAAALVSLAGVQLGKPPQSARLSLAQTARWLTCGGIGELESERELRPGPQLVMLHGASRPVEVIGPVGRIGELRPQWSATTQLGGDPPSFGL